MLTVLLSIGITTGLFLLLALVLLYAEHRLADYGICRVSVNDGHTVFEQDGGGTLLAALLDHGIYIPSACGGKGSCGYCKVTVRAGGGSVLPTETPYLTRREILDGVRLACQVKIRQSLEVVIPEDLLNVRQFLTRVVSTVRLTDDIRQIDVELSGSDEIHQCPGQYVQVQAPGPEGPVYRAYSISSPDFETKRIQLVVRLVPGGIASTYLHGLAPGDEAVMTGPYGEFRLSEDPDREVICVGGGCGMAPMRNIITSLYHRWPDRPCSLFFGCRTVRDVLYLDDYRQLAAKHPAFKLVYALSDPLGADADWHGETGFIHLAVNKHLEAGSGCQAFLCGPPPMIDAVMEVLKGKGLAEEDIFYDKF